MSEDPDFGAVTARQRAAWSAGGFNRVALTLMEVTEHLVATADPAPGSRVLDVACGTGNAALVTARRRAAAEGTDITFVEGDAQALPFEDASFDTVLSVFAVVERFNRAEDGTCAMQQDSAEVVARRR
jgi:ubiquinone/menaquinone biosynthesis C-methylase UbiE